MDCETGLTLFEPTDIKFNFGGNDEEDEEALADEIRRKKVLDAQLQTAFDDLSDDDKSTHDKSCDNSKSSSDDYEDDDGNDNVNRSTEGDTVQNKSSAPNYNPRGKTFRKLSNISEHSVNNSSDASGVFTNGADQSPSTDCTSGVMDEKGPYYQLDAKKSPTNYRNKCFDANYLKTPEVHSNSKNKRLFTQSVFNGRDDFKKQVSPLAKSTPQIRDSEKFGPVFAQSSVVQTGDTCMQTALNRGDYENQNYPEFRNYSQNQSSEHFRPFFNNTPSIEKSTSESEDAYRKAELNSENQLQVLYDVRMKEIQRLTAQLESERQEAASYKQQKLLDIALLQADKERAILSRTEAEKLLVSGKEQIIHLQKEVDDLKQTLEVVQKEKKQSDEMVELSRVQVQELENSVALMERCDSSMRQAKQTNIMIKDLKAKHQEELGLMQQQLDSVTKKLLEKEEDNRRMGQQLDQLTVDKAATIGQLTRALEDSQRKCQELLEANVMADNVKLHHQLKQVMDERDQLTQTVNNLKEECRSMKSTMETFSPTDSMVQMGLASRSGNHNSSTNLKAEFHRAMLNQKAKRAEVERLQELLSVKEKEIEEIRKLQQMSEADCYELKVELNEVKKELLSIKKQYYETKENGEKLLLKDIQEELEKVKEENMELRKETDLELKGLNVRLEQSLRETQHLKEKYLQVTTELGLANGQLEQVTQERDSLNAHHDSLVQQASMLNQEKRNLISEIQLLKEELSHIRSNTEHQKNEEDHLRQECGRLEQELTTMSARHAEELTLARNELQASRDRVSQLEKTTRQQFETRIKNLNQERDMLKTKCEEKEVQIKKLIECRKRAPSVASVATETEEGDKLEEERLHRQEYEAALAQMELVQQEFEQKHIEDKEHIRQTYLKVIEQLEQELVTVEERTKETIIDFFSEQFKALEKKYREELTRLPNNAEVERLRDKVAEQVRQIEFLSATVERGNGSLQRQLEDLTIEREDERRRAAALMEQWCHEVQNIQEELKIKEIKIGQLQSKLESAQVCAKTNYDKLVKTNENITETMNNKMSEFKAKVKFSIENYEKDVWEKVLKIESLYRQRERKLRQEFKKQLMAD